jgi:hypothetical protein
LKQPYVAPGFKGSVAQQQFQDILRGSHSHSFMQGIAAAETANEILDRFVSTNPQNIQ